MDEKGEEGIYSTQFTSYTSTVPSSKVLQVGIIMKNTEMGDDEGQRDARVVEA